MAELNVTVTLSPEQVRQLAEEIQVSLLKQARRNTRSICLPPNPHHEDIKRQMRDAVIRNPGEDPRITYLRSPDGLTPEQIGQLQDELDRLSAENPGKYVVLPPWQHGDDDD